MTRTDKENINLNLAIIVYRLLTNPRGWRVSSLMQELGIADRTYRKYRKLLQERFEPFQRADGSCMLEEVQAGDEVAYLRLTSQGSYGFSDPDFLARVMTLFVGRQLFGFLQDTEVGAVMEDFLGDFKRQLRDRDAFAELRLGDADRLFCVVSDARRDYSKQSEVLETLLFALLKQRRVEVDYDSASHDRPPMTLTLEPLTLVYSRSDLYLFARCPPHTEPRTYAVGRMRAARKLSERFEYPSRVSYDPREMVDGSFGIYHKRAEEPISVELLFADVHWLKVFLQERAWHPTQRFELCDDGRLRMTFSVNAMSTVWPWIRSFGEQVEVVSPKVGPKRSPEVSA